MDRNDSVLELIGTGKDHATPILRLVWNSGLNERAVRKAIQELRQDGHLICNEQNGKGYYIATELEEIRKQYTQDRNRFLAVAKRIKTERRILRDAGLLDEEEGSPVCEQMSLFDDHLDNR